MHLIVALEPYLAFGTTDTWHLDRHPLASQAETTLRPSVEILINQQPAGMIPLEVSLAMVVNGGLLTIKAGEIREVRIGKLEASGILAMAGVTLAEKKLKPIELPGTLRLAERKRIAAPGPPVAGGPGSHR